MSLVPQISLFIPALTVRFLTRRYIGEYDHQAGVGTMKIPKEIKSVEYFRSLADLDYPKFVQEIVTQILKSPHSQSENRYKHEVLVDGEPVLFEILDTCPKSEEDLPSVETLHWADGFLLVYAITDRRSFNYVRRVKQTLCCDTPLALVGNKGDMVHLRQVSTEEGEILAKDYECWFSEVAAAEQVTQVAEAFHELCREVLSVRRKNKQSLLDRMLGNKSAGLRAYSRGKSDSALPKD